MLKKGQNYYQLSNRYCLRTPVFSFFEYKRRLKKEIFEQSDFKQLLENITFREALFLASPELISQINKWQKGELLDKLKVERLQFAILKYFTRSTTRCTPFGLFASCSVGNFGNETSIQLNANTKRFTRFDTTFLAQLFQELLKNKDIKENVLFYPNTSIYKIGNHYRYVEYSIENKKRSYSLEGIRFSEYLEKIIIKAKKGKTVSELAIVLVDDEITAEEAKEYIHQLIDNQILVSELEITVTGKDYFTCLLERIEKIPEASKIYKQLVTLQNELKKLDAVFGNDITIYQAIINEAKELVPTLDSKYLFQTDSFSSFNQNTLNKHLQKQLIKTLVLFNKMTTPSANGNLVELKRKFLKCFEQSEVPLNLVLDTETGIGYGDKRDDDNDLLENLVTPRTKKRYERVIWTDIDTILQQKLVEATKNNNYSIIVTEEDFKDLPLNWNDLPDTFSSIIEVFNSEQQQQQIFIKGAGGSSTVNLLGRFSYGNKELLDHVSNSIAIEDEINSNKILAEIVHLPEARTGNILQRPSFRKYEIPYLGKASVENEYQIPLEDILVSVKNDRIVLRSKKHNKEILPRLGNAHNYSANPLPIYQFLCELQTQDKRSSIGFNWNPILKRQPFLPRVEFENCIFSKARWNIIVQDFKNICKEENLLPAIRKWQKEHMLPDFVELVDGDNRLLISLTNETSIKMLLHTVKNRKQFVLEEFLFNDNGIVKNENEDAFCNQFVISFYNDHKLKSCKK